MTSRHETEPAVQCVLIGAGGHASVLLDCFEPAGEVVIAGVLVPDRARWGTTVRDFPVLGGDDVLPALPGRGITHFIVGVGGTDDNRPRRALFELALAAGLAPLIVKHPSSVVSSHASIGPGCQLLPGSVVNAGARLSLHVIVNTGAVVEHDCQLGEHVHVATGARLAGGVTVGACGHIGAGATVLQGRTIGEGAVVGAGAVVVTDVAPFIVVAGVPARPLLNAKFMKRGR